MQAVIYSNGNLECERAKTLLEKLNFQIQEYNRKCLGIFRNHHTLSGVCSCKSGNLSFVIRAQAAAFYTRFRQTDRQILHRGSKACWLAPQASS